MNIEKTNGGGELVRLNKYLADKGIASRRKADELILAGIVKVNGEKVVELGVKVNPLNDKVELDNVILKAEEKKLVYLKMNKPIEFECSNNPPKGVKSVYELVPNNYKVFTVGRLDKMSEGLLLLTNDGRIAYKLTHPSFEKEKEYEVIVDRNISDADLERMSKGIKILGKYTKPADVERISMRKFIITIHEGMNRQIRRMCRAVGYRVHRLKRLRVGEIQLRDLRVGECKPLTPGELNYIKKILN